MRAVALTAVVSKKVVIADAASNLDFIPSMRVIWNDAVLGI